MNRNTEQSQSPNLLEPQKVRNFAAKNHLTVAAISKFIIIAVEVFFIGLLMYNAKLDTDINRLQKQVAALEAKIQNKEELEQEAKDVIERTKLLKSVREQRMPMSTRINSVIENIPEGVVIRKTKFEQEKFQVEIEAPTALDISKTISNYLSNNVVSELTLNSANLNTNTRIFTAEMEAVFSAEGENQTPFSNVQ